jgi:hypothetical protein
VADLSKVMLMGNSNNLAKLEGALERLVENAFAQLFRRPVSAHDIAVKLARSMQSNLRPAGLAGGKPIAPDRYRVHVHPQHYQRLATAQQELMDALVPQIIDLSARSGYQLEERPTLIFAADPHLGMSDVVVYSDHSSAASSTAMISPVDVVPQQAAPRMHLLIGARVIPLVDPVVNIGRAENNTIVLEDGYVSRHHVQLRLRHGTYLLFDAQSKSGTYVNEVLTREHRLQSGDVIRIGSTRMIFMIDGAPGRLSPGTTDVIRPVSP